MKRLLSLLVLTLLFGLKVSAQNYSTPGVPSGTTSVSPTFRYKAVSPDSLNSIWFSIGTKWYRIPTSVQFKLFDSNFRLVSDSVHLANTIHLKSTVIADTSLRIGTSTMPGWNAIYRILNMAGDVGIRAHTGAHDVMLFNNLYNSDGSQTWHYTNNGFGSLLYLDNGGGMNFYSAPTSTAGNTVSLTTPMFSVKPSGATITTLIDTPTTDRLVAINSTTGKLYKVTTGGVGITSTANGLSGNGSLASPVILGGNPLNQNTTINGSGFYLNYSNNSIGQNNPSTTGLVLQNNTASTGSLFQNSPALVLAGTSWHGGSSTSFDSRFAILAQGTNDFSSAASLKFRTSTDGGSTWADVATMSNAGELFIPSSVNSGYINGTFGTFTSVHNQSFSVYNNNIALSDNGNGNNTTLSFASSQNKGVVFAPQMNTVARNTITGGFLPQYVTVTAGGSGYTSAPNVVFTTSTGGATATGKAIIQSGKVVQVYVTDQGSGYTSTPSVSFSGGGGTGAAATVSSIAQTGLTAFNIDSAKYEVYTGATGWKQLAYSNDVASGFVNLTTGQNVSGIKQFLSPQSIGGAYDLHRNIVSGYPASVLDVVNDYGNNGGLYLAQFTAYADDTGEANFHYRKARGTAAAPTAILAGDFLFSAGFQGYGATGFQASSAAIQALATENFTDTNNGTKMQFQVTPNGSSLANRITALTIDQTGYTGLGYTDPQTQMEVLGTSRVSSAATQSFSQLVRYNGTRTAPSALAANDFIGLLSFVGQYDTSVGHLATGAFIGSYAESAWTSSTVHPTYMAFYTSPASGSYAERMRIAGNGNVGIGTTSSASRLNLAAGTTTTGAFNVAAGSVLTTPQSGTFEYNGTNIFFTDNTNSRKKIAYTAYVDSSFSATTTYFTPGMFSGLGTAGSNYNWGTNTIPMSALATTGTASSTTVLHGDGSWSAVSGGFANPMTTQGDLIKGGASGAATRVPLGGANQVLGVNTGATDVEYKTISGTNGVTFTPGSGTLAFSLDQSFSPTLTGIYTFATTNTASSGTGSVNYGTYLHHTVNQTSTAGFTDLLINRVNTAPGSGSQRLLDLQVGGTSVLNVNTSGGLTLSSGVTSNGIFTTSQFSTSSTFSSDGLYIYNNATATSTNHDLNSLRVRWMTPVWNTGGTPAQNFAFMYNELRANQGTAPVYTLYWAANLSTTSTMGTGTDVASLNNSGDFKTTRSTGSAEITFANKPASPYIGQVCNFSDSTVNTFGATIAGSGTNHVSGRWNGTNWTVTGI